MQCCKEAPVPQAAMMRGRIFFSYSILYLLAAREMVREGVSSNPCVARFRTALVSRALDPALMRYPVLVATSSVTQSSGERRAAAEKRDGDSNNRQKR